MDVNNTTTMMSGAEALVKSLRVNGIDTVFALPGVQLDNIFDALHKEGNAIRVIHTRHEQGAAYMAYGYAQASGKVGAYLVVPGPGVLNTSTALCTAHSSNSPVLAMTGHIPSRFIDRGLGILHEVEDQPGFFTNITKWQGRAGSPGAAPGMIDEAFRQMRSDRPGPVFVEMAVDITYEKAPVSILVPATPLPAPEANPEALEKAAELLGQAENPALFVGGGAVGAGDEVKALAEMLQAPVISTKHGKGVISDRHYLAQSLAGGEAVWGEVDVVLVIGSRFLEPHQFWGLDEDLTVIRIDLDAHQINQPAPPDFKLVTSAKRGLAELIGRVGPHNRRRPSREAELEVVKRAALDRFATLEPQKAYGEVLRSALPDEGVVVFDVTQMMFYSWFAWPTYQPRTVIYPGFQDSLGYGFATALGAKVAQPDHRVMCVTGDGGFMFTMPELSTAVQHGINLVTVINNDGRFGNVARTQRTQFDGRFIATDLVNPDFVAMAESFGAVGLRSESPEELADRLEEGFAAKLPVLIDNRVDEMPAWQPVAPRNHVRGQIL